MLSHFLSLIRLLVACTLSFLGSTLVTGDITDDTYDYVVVGSGPGGGVVASNLALAGYTVKLIEAGRDPSDDFRTYITELEYPEDDEIKWSFFVNTTSNTTQQLRYRLLTWTLPNGTYWVGSRDVAPEDATLNGVYYPRGATLGGSAVVNAMAFVLPNDATWDYIANVTEDDSWSHENMRSIFQRVERNHYLPQNTSGHGFNGYVDSSIDSSSFYEQEPGRLALLGQLARSLVGNFTSLDALLWYLERDTNPDDPNRDHLAEPFGLAKHENGIDRRWTPCDLIHEVLNTTDTLTLQLESLATRVLLDDLTSNSSKARAIGIEYLEGANIYGATWKSDEATAPKGSLKRAYARKEVMISGGTFNSPQLLQLSGIGNSSHLETVGIDTYVNLLGVGLNLRDNEELPVAGHSPVNITETLTDPIWANCTYGASGDPCLALWYQGTGPYTEPQGNSEVAFLNTNYSTDGTRDVITFSPPGVFRGFYPTTSQTTEGLFADSPNTLWRSIARMNVQNNGGWVRVTTSDPTAVPDININHYGVDAAIDIGAMIDSIAWIRRAFNDLPAPYGPVTTSEPPCTAGYGMDGYCFDRGEDEQWIRDQTFGHHPVGTCKMGAASDNLAVVDSRFRVHGAQGLRVVDASVFPISPGGFPVLATILIGQKASQVILEDA